MDDIKEKIASAIHFAHVHDDVGCIHQTGSTNSMAHGVEADVIMNTILPDLQYIFENIIDRTHRAMEGNNYPHVKGSHSRRTIVEAAVKEFLNG